MDEGHEARESLDPSGGAGTGTLTADTPNDSSCKVTLDRTRQLLDAHLWNSPLAVIEFDTEFRVIRWSAEAEKVFGYSEAEMLGKAISEMRWVYEEDVPLVEDESIRLFSGQSPRSKNVNRNYRKDGSVAWCEWYSSAIYDEQGKLVSVLSLVLDITEAKRAEEQRIAAERGLRQTVDLSQVLNDINEILLSSHATQDIFNQMLLKATQALTLDSAVVALKDDGGWQVAFAVNAPPDIAQLVAGGHAAATGTRSTGSTFGSEDASMDARLDSEFVQRLGVEAGIHVPLFSRGVMTGMLAFLDVGSPRQFSSAQISFVEHLGSSISLALENARSFRAEVAAREAVAQELETTKLLLQAANSLSGSTGVNELLDDLASVVVEVTGHGRAWVFDWNTDLQEITLIAAAGRETAAVGSSFRMSDLSALTRSAADVRQSGVIDFDLLPSEFRGLADSIQTHLALQVPLMLHDCLLGFIVIDDPGDRREFTGREIALVEGIAAQAAVVVQNARLLASERESARYAESLNRVNRAVHSTLDFGEIMRSVVREAREVTGVDAAVVELREGDNWPVRFADGLPDEILGKPFTTPKPVLASAVLEAGEPVIVEDAMEDPRFAEMASRHNIRSFAGVPLIARGEMLGALVMIESERSRRFGEPERDFMRKLATTVSLALDNARLYEAERHIADRLQEALISLPDEVCGISFAHEYHSATEAARVGGDFYDVFELSDDRVGIVIGDVAGKGLDAAVLTSMVKNTIRAHANERGKTPGRILELTNDLIHSSTPSEAFVTVFFGILDSSDGRVTYSSAGHTSGALLDEAGDVSKLSPTGPLLGAFPGLTFAESDAVLGEGSILFLYTDGLTEARRGRDFYGEERLWQLLRRVAVKSPSTVVGGAIDDVIRFSENELRDDLAILAVQRTPGERDR